MTKATVHAISGAAGLVSCWVQGYVKGLLLGEGVSETQIGAWLDALEGALDVFEGVAEGDGTAVGAGGGVLGFG